MKQIADNTRQKGLDIDELRYQRALALARYEMAKFHFKESVETLKGNIEKPRGIIGRIIGSLNYLDYAMLAFRLGSRIMKWRRGK